MARFWMMVVMVFALGLSAGCSDDTTCTDCSCNPALCDGGDADVDDDVGPDADVDSDTDTESDGSSCDSDDPAPIVAFVQPTDGAEVTGAQTVEISVTDRCGVSELTLAVDGAPSATWTEEPYTWVWDTSGLVSGNHTLTASATDAIGQTGSATVEVNVQAECLTPTNCPPRVRIVYPTAGSRVCGTLNVEATATGEDDVTEVEFQVGDISLGVDNTAPYQAEWNTTALADGNHSLTATARDASGQEAWHTVSVAVENTGEVCDNLPTAVIVEPADGSYVHGNVTVRVNASDDIGVVRVRVFVDAGMVWEDTTAPFEGTWNTDDFTEGPHLLRAESTDTADQHSADASIEVDVDRTPPTVAITSPYDGEAVSGTRVVVANATDNLSVASVTFNATGRLTRSFTDTEAPFAWSLDFPAMTACGDNHVVIEAVATDHADWTATDTVSVVLEYRTEVCNGRDDDCDGVCDNGFPCCADAPGCTSSCAIVGLAACAGGLYDPTSGLCWQEPPTDFEVSRADAIAYCDTLSLGGYGAGAWHLPTINELRSLIRGCPGTETGGVCPITDSNLSGYYTSGCEGCTEDAGPGAGGNYWPAEITDTSIFYEWYRSSSPLDGSPSNAWWVNFSTGEVDQDYHFPILVAMYVRCVRPGP